MGLGGLGQLGEGVRMSLWVIVIVLLCELVGMRMVRYSTGAIPHSQPVSYVSWLQRTNNKCELLSTHNRNNVSCMRLASITRRRRQPGTIMPET